MIRTPVALAAAALFLGSYIAPASANVFHVDDDGLDPFECEAAPFHSINEALAVANPGDEIRVCPGVYAEQVVLTQKMRLTGLSFGTAQPVIKPTSLPASRPSLLGGNAVTGAIIVDNEYANLSNLSVDLSNTSVSTCLPFLTGVYLRGSTGTVDKLNITNVRVSGNPTCESGVGLYVESGVIGEILGNPILAPARVNVRDVDTSGYQKAGVVGNGPRAVLNIKGGNATGDGASVGAVQYGYQIAFGAKGKISKVTADDHRSLITGKAAAGMLVYRGNRVSIRKSDVTDTQEGVFGIGDRLRVRKTGFVNMFGDGVVFIGDANLAASNLVDGSSVSGVFIKGDRNSVRGGVMRHLPFGIWFQFGDGNKYGGVRFDDVPVFAQGVYGGVRWDLGVDSAQPFTTECATAANCDDGNSCTSATCSEGHCTFTNLAAGAACDDGNSCTTDLCNAAGTCVGAPVPAGTICVDASPCTAGEVCNATGTCVGTPSGAGTSCDDGNLCTSGDTCSATGVCTGTLVAVGTACDDGNACTLTDKCDGFSVCRGAAAPLNTVCDDGNECTGPVDLCDTAVCQADPVSDLTTCAGGTLVCIAGVCS